MTHPLREGLPALPARMRALPIESRGYPVPWFVSYINGAPDFRVVDPDKWVKAVRFGNCWLCGERVGRLHTFVLGPLNVINRVSAEPPCHIDCARFAVKACPFMILRAAKRRDANLAHGENAPGIHMARNAGVSALWTTDKYRVFEASPGEFLLEFSEPTSVEWYSEARTATRVEVDEAISIGLPFLEGLARQQGESEVKKLEAQIQAAQRYYPPSVQSA
jgi:hypothetical protein